MNDLSITSVPAASEPAVMIAGESGAVYDDLLARIRAAVRPADVFEELWVREIADLSWEVARMRRLKAELMRTCAHEGMRRVLAQMAIVHSTSVADRWSAGDAAAAATVNGALAKAGFTLDAAMAMTLAGRIDEIERIECMAMAAQLRRDCMLREVERRRAGLAANVRAALRAAEEAGYEIGAASAGPARADA